MPRATDRPLARRDPPPPVTARIGGKSHVRPALVAVVGSTPRSVQLGFDGAGVEPQPGLRTVAKPDRAQPALVCVYPRRFHVEALGHLAGHQQVRRDWR
jgi:hypothetical protein